MGETGSAGAVLRGYATLHHIEVHPVGHDRPCEASKKLPSDPHEVNGSLQPEAVTAQDGGTHQSGPSLCVCRVTDARAKPWCNAVAPMTVSLPSWVRSLFLKILQGEDF